MFISMCVFLTGNILIATAPVDQTYWAQIFVCTIIIPWGMDMSFPAGTLILSNSVKKEHQGMGASLVNTVVNYSVSIGVGIAGTVEVHLNQESAAPVDLLRSYRGSLYLAVGLAGLGMLISVMFLVKTSSTGEKERNDKEDGPEEKSEVQHQISRERKQRNKAPPT